MAGTWLSKSGIDPTSSTTTATWSFWFKTDSHTDGSTEHFLFSTYSDANSRMHIKLDANNCIDVNSRMSSTVHLSKITNRRLNDPTAWYHLVVTIDTTDATADDRCKIYVNGVRETSFSSSTNPSQNQDIQSLQGNQTHYVATYGGNTGNAFYTFGGCMSCLNFIDGTAYQASTFGSTDSSTGEWKINVTPTVTYGNNGWFILKNGSGITNLAGNSAGNFTLGGGTLTTTVDNPSDNYCSLNPRGYAANSFTLIELNNYSGGADNNWRSIFGTLGAKAGKYYYEMKCISSSDYERFGACTVDQANKCTGNTGRYDDSGYGSEGYGYTSDGEKSNNGGTTGGYGDTWGANDILSCALDLDNNKIYFGKNGTWQDSGDPTSGSTGTGAAYTIAADKFYIPAFASYGSAANLAFNFGNGLFRTTAISSEGTNASGVGKFEYDVPTGYTAWSTKGLNK